MQPYPDPAYCVHECVEHGRAIHYYQCPRKPTQEVEGYKLCGQHAARARKNGYAMILTGRGLHAWNRESKRVDVPIDEAKWQAAREKEQAKERERRAGDVYCRARKWRLIAEHLAALVPDDVDDLLNAHPDDVEAMIAAKDWRVCQ